MIDERKFWELCGLFYGFTRDSLTLEKYGAWFISLQTPSACMEVSRDLPSIHSLDALFKYAVPVALSKLESRFDTKTNTLRAFDLLFCGWVSELDKDIDKGFALALAEAIYKALGGKE